MNLLRNQKNNKANAAENSKARHNAFLREYTKRLSEAPSDDGAERHVTIVARSPKSPVMLAVAERADELSRHGVHLQIIFSELGGEGSIADLVQTLTGMFSNAGARECIRWARKSCLKDAHEQITLGTSMCWSGDCMRREPGKVDSLELFESDTRKTVRFGQAAFESIWTICVPVPNAQLDPNASLKPSGSYGAAVEGGVSAFSFLRRPERSNPLSH